MNYAGRVAERCRVIRELFGFFWKRKLWWMIPMLAVLLLVGILVIFVQSSSVAPFIYVLF